MSFYLHLHLVRIVFKKVTEWRLKQLSLFFIFGSFQEKMKQLFVGINQYSTSCWSHIYPFLDQETSFKEWKLVVQEIVRFMKADTAFANVRPLRYCAMFDSYPASLPYMSRFHAKKVLKFRDALLTSYHRNEVSGYIDLVSYDIIP